MRWAGKSTGGHITPIQRCFNHCSRFNKQNKKVPTKNNKNYTPSPPSQSKLPHLFSISHHFTRHPVLTPRASHQLHRTLLHPPPSWPPSRPPIPSTDPWPHQLVGRPSPPWNMSVNSWGAGGGRGGGAPGACGGGGGRFLPPPQGVSRRRSRGGGGS